LKEDSILSLVPEVNSHGPVDKIVRGMASKKVKFAIICPPTIWGVGRGTGNTRSIQIYNLTSLVLSRGAGVKIPVPSADKLFWPNIHIHDLSNLYLPVIEDAISSLEGTEGRTTWNEAGYYFAENGRHYWQHVSGWVAEEAVKQGLINDATATDLDEGDQKELDKAGLALWNLVSDCKSIRGQRLFGWAPKEGTLKDEIPDIVRSEAKRLGLESRHDRPST
jgi:hypothetical protein